MKFQWEKLDSECQRAKVIGGWVLRSRDVDDCNTHYTVESMVFIHDPKHEWNIEVRESELSILNKKVCDFDEWDGLYCSVRIINCLRVENIETIKDLLQTSKCYLRKSPNLGKKSISTLDEFLLKIGFKLNEGSYSDTIHTKYEIRRIE